MEIVFTISGRLSFCKCSCFNNLATLKYHWRGLSTRIFHFKPINIFVKARIIYAVFSVRVLNLQFDNLYVKAKQSDDTTGRPLRKGSFHHPQPLLR